MRLPAPERGCRAVWYTDLAHNCEKPAKLGFSCPTPTLKHGCAFQNSCLNGFAKHHQYPLRLIVSAGESISAASASPFALPVMDGTPVPLRCAPGICPRHC